MVPIIRGDRVAVDISVQHPIRQAADGHRGGRLTAVTVDFPTPPLPETTAYTRVQESGCANGMTGSRMSPRNCLRSSIALLVAHRQATRTAEVPGVGDRGDTLGDFGLLRAAGDG